MDREKLITLFLTSTIVFLLVNANVNPISCQTDQVELVEVTNVSIANAFDVSVNEDVAFVTSGLLGVKSFDISDLSNITLLDTISQPTTTHGAAYAHQITYEEGYLFIGDGWGGLRIINATKPNDLVDVSSVFNTTGPYGWVVRVTGSYALLGSGQNGGAYDGVLFYDISEMTNPSEIAYYPTTSAVVDLEISNDKVYIFLGDRTLIILDITDVSNPKELVTFDAYSVVGFYGGDLEVVDDIVYLTTWQFDPLIIDTSDLQNIKVLSESFFDSESHFSVLVNNDLAFYAATFDGIGIFNISDPSNPQQVGLYEPSDEIVGSPYMLDFSDGYLFCTFQSKGLWIFEIQENFSEETSLDYTNNIDNGSSTYGFDFFTACSSIVFTLLVFKNLRKKK